MNDIYPIVTPKRATRAKVNLMVDFMPTVAINDHVSISQYAKMQGLSYAQVYSAMVKGKIKAYRADILGINRYFINTAQPNVTPCVRKSVVTKTATIN